MKAGVRRLVQSLSRYKVQRALSRAVADSQSQSLGPQCTPRRLTVHTAAALGLSASGCRSAPRPPTAFSRARSGGGSLLDDLSGGGGAARLQGGAPARLACTGAPVDSSRKEAIAAHTDSAVKTPPRNAATERRLLAGRWRPCYFLTRWRDVRRHAPPPLG